jgi:hypothetical protein
MNLERSDPSFPSIATAEQSDEEELEQGVRLKWGVPYVNLTVALRTTSGKSAAALAAAQPAGVAEVARDDRVALLCQGRRVFDKIL